MARTHYEILGVQASSTSAEVRSAYRRLVMIHHPDRSADPKSKAIFIAVTEAYEVLGDPERRKQYDLRLAVEQKAASRPQRPQSAASPSARMAEINLDVNRLSVMVSRGNYLEADSLARSILERDRRQPVPYAVLGDLAKMRGDKREALRLYGLALQYDPRNSSVQRRMEETFEVPSAAATPLRAPIPQKAAPSMAMPFGIGLVAVAGVYVAFAHETPLVPALSLISTWTLGLVVMLFFSGVVLGACLALDRLVGAFGSSRSSALSPTVALASIAIVNFWGAVLIYVLMASMWRAFNVSTSRVLASVAAGTAVLALAGEFSGSVSGLQVVIWGGNVVYAGSMCGWMVADALRQSA